MLKESDTFFRWVPVNLKRAREKVFQNEPETTLRKYFLIVTLLKIKRLSTKFYKFAITIIPLPFDSAVTSQKNGGFDQKLSIFYKIERMKFFFPKKCFSPGQNQPTNTGEWFGAKIQTWKCPQNAISLKKGLIFPRFCRRFLGLFTFMWRIRSQWHHLYIMGNICVLYEKKNVSFFKDLPMERLNKST